VRGRAAEEVPLPGETGDRRRPVADAEDRTEHLRVLDAFGHNPSAGLLDERDRRSNGRIGGRVEAESSDHLAVDLDHVEADVRQGPQARVALAHVVQGQTEAQSVCPLEDPDRLG